jgi:hypothetical protein
MEKGSSEESRHNSFMLDPNKVEREVRRAGDNIVKTPDFLAVPRKQIKKLALNYLVAQLKVDLLVTHQEIAFQKLNVSEFDKRLSKEEAREKMKSLFNLAAQIKRKLPGNIQREIEKLESIITGMDLEEPGSFMKAGEYFKEEAEKERRWVKEKQNLKTGVFLKGDLSPTVKAKTAAFLSQKHNLRAEKFSQLGAVLIKIGEETPQPAKI